MSFVFILLRVCHTDMMISGTALLSLNVSRNLNLCQETGFIYHIHKGQTDSPTRFKCQRNLKPDD